MAKAEPMGSIKFSSRVATLKHRSDFQQIKKGARWSTPAFVLEARQRSNEDFAVPGQPRFGFTVTKRVGKAVERNRIRRRLKAAVKVLQMDHANSDFDYVLIARRPALEAAFATLLTDLAAAFDRVHRPPARGRKPGRPPAAKVN